MGQIEIGSALVSKQPGTLCFGGQGGAGIIRVPYWQVEADLPGALAPRLVDQ